MATEMQNSGIPATNSRVPSSGSTTHTRSLSSRLESSTLSSDNQPSPSLNKLLRSTASMAWSASVTGLRFALYLASIARILDVKYHLLLPAIEKVGGPLDYFQWSSILRTVSACLGATIVVCLLRGVPPASRGAGIRVISAV